MMRLGMRGWRIALLGVLVLVLALALPGWARCSAQDAPSGGAAHSASGGNPPNPGGSGNDDGQAYQGDNDDHDDGEISEDVDVDEGDEAIVADEHEDATNGDHSDGANEATPAEAEMAGYARSLGLCEEFAASVALQAATAHVDGERLQVTLRLIARLVQEGYLSDLAPAAGGANDSDDRSVSFARLDGGAQASIASALMEMVRTRDQEWLRQRLEECARAGMTVEQAVSFLAGQ